LPLFLKPVYAAALAVLIQIMPEISHVDTKIDDEPPITFHPGLVV
jgi:hypothetical protein